jgi:hypothetical protein
MLNIFGDVCQFSEIFCQFSANLAIFRRFFTIFNEKYVFFWKKQFLALNSSILSQKRNVSYFFSKNISKIVTLVLGSCKKWSTNDRHIPFTRSVILMPIYFAI